VWLKDGMIVVDSDVHSAVGEYRTWTDDLYHRWIDETAVEAVFHQGTIEVVKAEVTGPGGGLPRGQDELVVELALETPQASEGELCIGITEGSASPVFLVTQDMSLRAGPNRITCTVAHLPLAAGRYYLWLQYEGEDRDMRLPWQPAGPFTVVGAPLTVAPIGVMRASAVEVDASWHVNDE
jgi:ABC-2 type transport system ATP-binding protein